MSHVDIALLELRARVAIHSRTGVYESDERKQRTQEALNRLFNVAYDEENLRKGYIEPDAFISEKPGREGHVSKLGFQRHQPNHSEEQ